MTYIVAFSRDRMHSDFDYYTGSSLQHNSGFSGEKNGSAPPMNLVGKSALLLMTVPVQLSS